MALKLIDLIVLKRKTGVNLFAESDYGPEDLISARWNDEQKLTKDTNGLEFISNSTIYYTNPETFEIGDAVKLNDSSDDFLEIKAIEKFRNGRGTKFFNIAYLSYGKQ